MFATAIIYGVVQLPDTTPVQIRFRVDEGVALSDGRVEWSPLQPPALEPWPRKTPRPYRMRLSSARAALGRPWLIRVITTTPHAQGNTEARVPFTQCREPSDSTRVDLVLQRR
jgi:hypothetical protein